MTFVLSLAAFAFANAQDKVVTGKVTDSKDGSPLQSVSVLVKGTTRGGTQTAADGTFRISVPANATTLVFSSVGYQTQEVAIGSGALNVSLVATTGVDLNEVVVVGYGTQRRKDVTGAVATVSTEDFQKGAIQSPEQLIAGKVAGIQISANGGAPGAGSRIRIRGGASLNASNDPLIVIDGVPVDGGVAGSVNPLNLLNPDDIETFTILKDPSAAAIYGSRGSNGVILITTKKGRRGKTQFNASANFFLQTPSNKVDVLSADEIRQIVASKGSTSDAAKLGTANTDWQDEIFDPAFGQDINLSATGATLKGRLPFRISGGFLNQDGVLKTGNFQRQTLSFNFSPKFLKDRLAVTVNLKGARTANVFANEGAIGTAISYDPTQPVYVSSNRFGGFFEYLEPSSTIGTGGFVPRELSPRNPVGLLEQRDDKSEVYRSIGNVMFDYSLPWVRGLRANLNLGYDIQSGSGTVKIPDSAASSYRRFSTTKITSGPNNGKDSINHYGGVNNQYKQNTRNLLLDFYLNYAKDINSIRSRIEAMAGYGYQDFYFKTWNYADYRFDGSEMPNSQPKFPYDDPRYTMISYYGRLTYTLANKYTLQLNARADGVSKYNPEDRWGFFPSAAIAWRISQEDFLKDSKTVNDLKLRVSHGVTGQQAGIGFYGYIPRYAVSNDQAQYQLGTTFYGMYRPSAYDPNLKWETTTNTGVALDFALFKNRVSGTVEGFFRKTKDLLSTVPIALGTNFSNRLLTNVGNIESKGVEITLNVIPVQRNNFTWELATNFTYVDPEITNLLLNPDPNFKGVTTGGISGGTGNTIQIHSVGYKPNSFYVYKQVYDQAGKPIEGLYEDLNRDGIINTEDLYRYKSSEPTFLLGISSDMKFRKWTLGFTMRGSFDNYVYNNVWASSGTRSGIFNPLGWINNGSRNYLETGFENIQYFSDYYVQNASFLRMDNINIGYDAGEVFRKAFLRVNFNIQNAFVITNYKGVDPEISWGIDNNFYPRPRTYSLGLNLNF
ncbi:MAG TPA: SusC/RagA family TonB-linked outer membrane protein [Chitinophagaceae bacterium]